ncbi:MAG TPA: hypothetical protein VH723_03935 [Candidatus Limnocylindrales bacterium]|jgi:hypothetical protein
MAHLVRKCDKCGTTDTKQSWSSMDEATKDGAFEKAWTCPSCAWPEFELVPGEHEPANA